MKAPMDERYDEQVPPQKRWNASTFQSTPQLRGVKLLIDLTHTDRYYSKDDMAAIGVTVQKVECAGYVLLSLILCTSMLLRLVTGGFFLYLISF